MTQAVGNGIQSLSPPGQLLSSAPGQESMPCQPWLLPTAKSLHGLQTIPAKETLEPQQAGEKPLALISGTSKRMGKPRCCLGKYVVLLKYIRGRI